MKASEFLALFPAVERDVSTGGGCTAWELRFPSGHYVLITDGEDALQPTLSARRATFGVGLDCEDVDGEETVSLTWVRAVPWMRERIAKYGARPRALTRDERFFYEWAGCSWKPPQTQEEGRREGAIALAMAERIARDTGYSFQWARDAEVDSSSFSRKRPTWSLWVCAMRDPLGKVYDMLGAIDFGADGEPWGDPYRRVVEAELSLGCQAVGVSRC